MMARPTLLVAALAVMSVVVMVESKWLVARILPPRYAQWLTIESVALLLQSLYFLGLPYSALVSGLLPARFLGLKGLDILTNTNLFPLNQHTLFNLAMQLGNVLLLWLPDIGPLVSVGVLLSVLFFAYLWLYMRPVAFRLPTNTLFPLYRSNFDILFDVVHWSFYRAVAWLAMGSLYLGIIVGTLMMVIEEVAASRVGRQPAIEQQRHLLRFAIGFLASVVFLFAPNLWLIFALQLIVAAGSSMLIKYMPNNVQSGD